MGMLEIQFSCNDDMAQLYNIQVEDVNKQIVTLQDKLKVFQEGKGASADYIAKTKEEL